MLGGIPQGSALGPLLFLVYVNEMPLKVQHSCLLQFADDTCLICAGDTSDIVAKTLQDDLTTLSGWVTESKMQLNIKNLVLCGLVLRGLPSNTVNDIHLSPPACAAAGITFDTKLNWSYHVANVCRNMSYYLIYTLISPHVKSLPSHYQNADGIFSFSTLYLCLTRMGSGHPSGLIVTLIASSQ